MTSTRETRNAGRLEDAIAMIGSTITVTEHLVNALASVLPDDYPIVAVLARLDNLRQTHDGLAQEVGL